MSETGLVFLFRIYRSERKMPPNIQLRELTDLKEYNRTHGQVGNKKREKKHSVS